LHIYNLSYVCLQFKHHTPKEDDPKTLKIPIKKLQSPIKKKKLMDMDMDIDPPSQIKDKDLFKAAETGDSSTFKSLPPERLSKALSLQNDDGRSVLHVAASSGHPEVKYFFLVDSLRFSWQ
jgi:26S proteasome non-ATPase regulatory subunit 10